MSYVTLVHVHVSCSGNAVYSRHYVSTALRDKRILRWFIFLIPAVSPSLTVPEDITDCIPQGQSFVHVTWDEISASYADDNPVLCEVGAIETSLTGHTFTLGTYTVYCTARNNAGCDIMKAFQVIVQGKRRLRRRIVNLPKAICYNIFKLPTDVNDPSVIYVLGGLNLAAPF